MGKPTGFMEYQRRGNPAQAPQERVQHFDEFHPRLSREERRRQGARCMECGVPFCQSGSVLNGMVSGCPLHNLIPEWNDLIYTGNFGHAVQRLLKTNNFPEFTGRVCPALCEAACTCGLNGEAVTIKENELGAIEDAWETGLIRPHPPKVRTGKQVAVVGSGPSGLAAADQLNKRGHTVTVFERADRIGGLLMYGIPNMKLEKQIVQRRVDLMAAEGVNFVTGVDVGKDKPAKELLRDFDAVVLCCGAGNPRDLSVPGRSGKDVYFAVDFLKSTTKSLLDSQLKDKQYLSAKGKRVVIVGGGDTGNDCVGTCIRHGCKSVVQLEMMPKAPDRRTEHNPWPEWPRVCKTDYGQEEAIAVFGRDPRVYQTTVTECVRDDKGRLTALQTVKLTPDLKPVEGSESTIPCDLLLIAAGFLGCENYVPEAFGAALTPRAAVQTEAGRYASSVPRVFTAGDMHRGQSLVVWAIQEGRAAAREVDESLMGYTNLE
ncbi:MAG: glutamate synthase subunit beta [Clostridiales bacterium]|uniref:Glutamate synthase subunit beta n=1 Tax=Intestinimonas massiliensis (ex Afouda et al. 2020) TaxID=1673721 RepID=A0ABS9M4L0_9FIRM|nr:glutamate synthase subunit beta [Intestinimonas massiliensis (ex Afouda et al. 2020)]MCG4525460.1 glutamate synthase subunit beta [Intestinimonas massiliensis (ex Afouda et al. 2020)]MCQ4806520.1 glutamate synthase subunit beta [Intestinimonas massiliensis (ex Afouda et al. 2020)]MDU1323567.1 glutamate synthase subunit beta [Clostridiales bacterium]